jgi:tRNA(adenine34) deaminase
VGAVLAGHDGTILAGAHNECLALHDPTAHAEILALRRAAAQLGNCRLGRTVLIVSLEPCLMCAGALVHARVDGIVYGATDPLAGAVSSRLEALALPFHNHTVWHMGGVAGGECAALLQDFFRKRR